MLSKRLLLFAPSDYINDGVRVELFCSFVNLPFCFLPLKFYNYRCAQIRAASYFNCDFY